MERKPEGKQQTTHLYASRHFPSLPMPCTLLHTKKNQMSVVRQSIPSFYLYGHKLTTTSRPVLCTLSSS